MQIDVRTVNKHVPDCAQQRRLSYDGDSLQLVTFESQAQLCSGMSVNALQAYVRQLKERNQEFDYEPEFDDKDDKKDKELR